VIVVEERKRAAEVFHRIPREELLGHCGGGRVGRE
jgi:hypothetical protein